MRAQRAVDLTLDRAHDEEVVLLRRAVVERQLLRHLVVRGEAHHDVEPDRQRALLLEPAQEVDRLEADPGVVERGHALGQRLRAGELDLAPALELELARRHPRAMALDRGPRQALRRLPQEARRLAVLVAHQLAPGRIGRLGVDPRQLHGPGVDERGVAAGVGQVDRVARAGRRQRVVHRVALDRRLGGSLHFSWCQPRPRIQSPGSAAAAARRTSATIASQLSAAVRSRIVLARPRLMK